MPDADPDVAVVDYVAGMTDRFALREFERIGLGVGAQGAPQGAG